MTAKNKNFVFILAILSITVAQVAWFLCLPALPSMQVFFQINPQMIAFTSSIFFLGMGPIQFFYGPISDYYGRKPVLVFGISIFIAASLIAFFANTILTFLIARFIQGLGVGACSTLGRAIIRDRFADQELAKKSSQLSMALSITPFLAPAIGSYLQYFFSWHAIFLCMCCYGILVWLFALFLFEETNRFLTRCFSIKILLNDYKTILSNHQFMAFLFIGTLTLTSEIVFNTFASFIFQNHFHLTPIHYGWLMIIFSIGFLAGAYASSLLLNANWTIERLIQCGVILNFISGFSLFLLASTYATPIITLLPMILFTFSTGLIYPNTAAAAMTLFKEKAGIVGALLSAMQLLSAGAISTLLMSIINPNLLHLSLILIIFALLSILTHNKNSNQQFNLFSFIFIKK